MRKNFTLSDLNYYDQELDLLENSAEEESPGPSSLALLNILNYASALSIVKTRMLGHYGLLLN